MAERKTIFEVNYISDHDCEYYQIGEIDTWPEDNIERYIAQFGEYGYDQMIKLALRVIVASDKFIRLKRQKEMDRACQSGSL